MSLFDPEFRKASFDIYVPACILQAASPMLLKHGLISNYELSNLLAVWIPSLGKDRFKEFVDESNVNLLNTKIQDEMNNVLHSFIALSKVLENPNDIIPMLPLGIYVKFRYSFSIDDFPYLLIDLKENQITGIPELNFSLAECFHFVLEKINPSGPDYTRS